MTKLFTTTVSGVGPFCIEFDDGEIVTTRTRKRQNLIATALDTLNILREFVETIESFGEWEDSCFYYHQRSTTELELPLKKARAAIAKAEGRE